MPSPPAKVILDTDMGGGYCNDVDDVGALAMLHALADNGEVELLAVVIDAPQCEVCAGAVSVVNHRYGRDDLPIGAYRGCNPQRDNCGVIHPYVRLVSDNWPSPIKSTADPRVHDATELYRRSLAAQPDGSVVIVSVGMLTNLMLLLQSQPDAHSDLDGRALVAQKVRHVGIMAGDYLTGIGDECNMRGGWGPPLHRRPAAAHSVYTVHHLPRATRVFFLGGTLGGEIYHGAALLTCVDANDPLRAAYNDYLDEPQLGRPSWDPLTALVAVRGAAAVGLRGFELGEPSQCPASVCDGVCTVTNAGISQWQVLAAASLPASNMSYLTFASNQWQTASQARDVMDALLCQAPRNAPLDTAAVTPAAAAAANVWEAHPYTNCYSGHGALNDLEDPACCVGAPDVVAACQARRHAGGGEHRSS